MKRSHAKAIKAGRRAALAIYPPPISASNYSGKGGSPGRDGAPFAPAQDVPSTLSPKGPK